MEALSDPETRWSAVEALGRIGDLRAAPALSQLLQDPAPEVRIEVIQALSHFNHPQMLDFVRNVAKADPSRAVRSRAFEITLEMAARQQTKLADEEQLKQQALAAKSVAGEPKLNALLVATRNNGASDFHLSVGQPPVIRLAADLVRAQGEPFTAQQTEAMVREILTDAQWERVQQERQLDFCHYIPTAGRYRANVFIDQKGMNGVFRVIPERPPTIAEIALPPHLAEIADYHQGLVIVCGPSGSGKSTTLAALVNLFNETRHDHVITMEDPVEFVHPFKNCLINQREVGRDTKSFARALRAALREDPDVVVIGELRDTESVVARAHRRRDRPHRARHAQLHLGAQGGRPHPGVVPGRRAGPGARGAVGVAQVRDRAAPAAVQGAAQAGGGLRGAAQHGGGRQHDPRGEDVPDPLGDADRQVARACRRSTTRSRGSSPPARSAARRRTARPPRRRTSRPSCPAAPAAAPTPGAPEARKP